MLPERTGIEEVVMCAVPAGDDVDGSRQKADEGLNLQLGNLDLLWMAIRWSVSAW